MVAGNGKLPCGIISAKRDHTNTASQGHSMKLADIETVGPDGRRHRVTAEEWKARQRVAVARNHY
ncbi:MAG: hypothetical protein A3H35_05345 [Betaproteobacteria bacterium RIFCSPLOWO2_02_FULL_62_17]|nr:MAG: hypothetical protein A3H35_05345 [Betaproteobacteria bacterium RIFCSPLOWO2_02_FULL_62_17]